MRSPPKEMCGDRHPTSVIYVCTLDAGHEDDHLATGLGDKVWARWPNTSQRQLTLFKKD